jgi:hypothetical protein
MNNQKMKSKKPILNGCLISVVKPPSGTNSLLGLSVAALLPFIVSCATTASDETLRLPAVALTVVGTPSTVDERARFRGIFCEVLKRPDAKLLGEGKCEDYLWRLSDEASDVPSHTVYSTDSRSKILIVGGAFGDCFPPASTPFIDSVKRLQGEGLAIDYIEVSGRSSSDFNAHIIAARIAATPFDVNRPLILIGYSKGIADILETLARYSEAAHRVSAVISIAGAVNGSPLASHYLKVYHRLLAKRSMGVCLPGDGGVIDSLESSRRMSWLATNSLPEHIRYYSIATFTTPYRLARVLASSQRQLSKIDPRNDGQLLAQDELIPGSALLGYANADHWGVALRMEDRFPFLAHRSVGRHPYPQQAMLEAILIFVQEDLNRAVEFDESTLGEKE